ncbi:SirB1 family protein [Caulobacter sp. S45]|uniref:SirB1 family protein n=1 Tax=Caulobacter sp. S45 TaxID=1641861 RepID=UPI001575B716|nr:transglutaminase family protein [Caulobacter sp. S45]
MTRRQAEDALAAAGRAPDGRFPLYEAALSCALHEDSARDADAARRLVDEAQERLRRRLVGERPDDALGEALGGDLQLKGDLLTPHDPANADLIAVCDRRRGLSIALGLIYLEAGRRAGLTLAGVDFPGHFLLRVETGEGPVALDPFSGGAVVMPSELTRRALSAGLMPGVGDRLDALMAPAGDRQIVLRLQSLIFARAMRAGDHEGAERAALRRGLIDPGDPCPWLDVATAREAQGRLTGALEALHQAKTLSGLAAGPAEWASLRVRRRLN